MTGADVSSTIDPTERLVADLVARYRAGSSLTELSEHVGRSYGYVRRRLLDAGVALRPRGGIQRCTQT